MRTQFCVLQNRKCWFIFKFAGSVVFPVTNRDTVKKKVNIGKGM